MDAQGGARARPFVEKAGLTIPALVDRRGRLWERFDFRVVPVQLYFDETGALVYRSSGAAEGEALERLDEALKRPRQASAEPLSVAPAPSHEAARLFEKGVAALDAGRRDEALALWKRALAEDPENWLIRKQIWTLEAPEAFWGGEDIDFAWQRERRRQESER